MQQNAYTVTQLTNTIKTLLEGHKTFQGFVLKGEISNFVRHRTGHLYFALKDENAQIKGIMFAGNANSLTFNPKDGDKVTVTGSISLYAPQGSYSIQVSKMQLDGAGELYLKYLELKKKLDSLGWFNKPKKELPKYPKTIGVVTSPTGAVIEDITNTINRRYRLTNILLYPSLVQGPSSSESVSRQIEKANLENKVDVLIVGRGGGSIEDLWGFNELATISAIYNSKIPVITAIGHETDDTISDLVSDLRAPTPTAAAELATPDTLELINYLNKENTNIKYRFTSLLSNKQSILVNLVERLELSSPTNKIINYKEKLNNQELLLNNYYKQKLLKDKNNLNNLTIKLKSLSPRNKLIQSNNKLEQLKVILHKNYNYLYEKSNSSYKNINKELLNNYEKILYLKKQEVSNILEILKKINPLTIMQRGFTIVKDEEDKIITSIEDIKLESKIEVDFHDGKIIALVKNKKEKK